MGDHCLPQLAIMCHVFLYSQGVHILCQTCSPLFPGPSHLSAYHPHFLYFIQHTPHISLTSVLDFPFFHFTPAMYLNILQSHLCRTSISQSVSGHVSVPKRRADLIQTLKTLPLVFKSMLRLTTKLETFRHLPHAADNLACTDLSTPASQSNISPR